MTTGRLNILPDPSFLELRPLLSERLARMGASIGPEHFGALLDTLMRETLAQGFAAAAAHEGTVWLLDDGGEHLVPAYNSGPQAEQIVGKFKQPLSTGLICMVLASEQPFVENEVWKNARQSKLLDSVLKLQTCAMIAVPFHFMGACRGVVSCVQLKRPGSLEPDPPGFRPEHLARIHGTAEVLARLIEYRLLSRAIGWTCE